MGAHDSVALDEVDRLIIDELVKDGRLSVRVLAERIHLSRSQTYARLERLLDSGVISHFTAVVSPERVGLQISAFIAITIDHPAADSIQERLQSIAHVHSIYLLASAFEILVLVRAPSQAALRDIVMTQLRETPGVVATKTWLILSESQNTPFPASTPHPDGGRR